MRIHRNLLLSAVVALAVAAPAAAGPGNGGNDPQGAKDDAASTAQSEPCNDEGDFIEYSGDTVLWPPNHKPTIHEVTAVDVDNNDTTTTIATVSSHDETGLNGAGDPSNVDTFDGDAGSEVVDGNDGRVTTTVTLLAERSGRGDGRTYQIDATAEFDEGMCSAQFLVEVPHDMRSDNAPEPKAPSLDENGEPKGGGNG